MHAQVGGLAWDDGASGACTTALMLMSLFCVGSIFKNDVTSNECANKATIILSHQFRQSDRERDKHPWNRGADCREHSAAPKLRAHWPNTVSVGVCFNFIFKHTFITYFSMSETTLSTLTRFAIGSNNILSVWSILQNVDFENMDKLVNYINQNLTSSGVHVRMWQSYAHWP